MLSTYPINYRKGVEMFGGDEEMFNGLIIQFEELNFNESLNKLYHAMVRYEWEVVRKEAHTLKGSSSYLAAEKFTDAALHLQLAAESEIEKDIVSKYIDLMNEARVLKIHLTKFTGKEINTQDIDRYIKEFSSKRPDVNLQMQEKAPDCCKPCIIF